MKAIKVIESIYFTGSQSVSYREIYKQEDKKIKIELKSDSYLDQSYARASVLVNDKWSVIYSIPSSLLGFEKGLSYRQEYRDNPKGTEKEFKADVKKIKEQVTNILF